MPFFAKTDKTNVPVKCRIMDIQPKEGSHFSTLPGHTFIPSLKKICYLHQLLAKQFLDKWDIKSRLSTVWAKNIFQDTWTIHKHNIKYARFWLVTNKDMEHFR